jgi:hypothetical protein
MQRYPAVQQVQQQNWFALYSQVAHCRTTSDLPLPSGRPLRWGRGAPSQSSLLSVSSASMSCNVSSGMAADALPASACCCGSALLNEGPGDPSGVAAGAAAKPCCSVAMLPAEASRRREIVSTQHGAMSMNERVRSVLINTGTKTVNMCSHWQLGKLMLSMYNVDCQHRTWQSGNFQSAAPANTMSVLATPTTATVLPCPTSGPGPEKSGCTG